MVIVQCSKCGKNYVMGVNGVVNGCDECTGTVRVSPHGYAAEHEQLKQLHATLDRNEKRIQQMQDQFYVMKTPVQAND